jgi:pyrroloquinoline-quinone synthase
LEQWLRLGEALGLSRASLLAFEHVAPGVRFACDAYVTLVRERSLLEGVAASLTECFAPKLMLERLAAFHEHYRFVDASALEYFDARVPRARRDAEEALAFVVKHARTFPEQAACVDALVRKTEILWHLLDGVSAACELSNAAHAAA